MKNTFRFLALVLSLVLVFFVASCKPETEYPVEVNGAQVDIAPNKVAALSDVAIAVIEHLGYGDRLVKGDFGTPLNLNVENLFAENVSVVFTPANLSAVTLNQLKSQGIVNITLPSPDNFEELKAYYMAVAKVMGGNITGKEAAEFVINPMQESLDNIAEFLSTKNKYSYVFIYEEGFAANNKSFANNMLSLIGGNNKMGENNTITAEELIKLNPDTLIVNIGLKEKIINNQNLSQINAVKNNKIIEIDVAAFNKMGKGFMDSLYTILENQYPDFINDGTQKE